MDTAGVSLGLWEALSLAGITISRYCTVKGLRVSDSDVSCTTRTIPTLRDRRGDVGHESVLLL